MKKHNTRWYVDQIEEDLEDINTIIAEVMPNKNWDAEAELPDTLPEGMAELKTCGETYYLDLKSWQLEEEFLKSKGLK